MSNYIIEYLAPYTGNGFVKEAGWVSKLLSKIRPVEVAVAPVEKKLMGIKNPIFRNTAPNLRRRLQDIDANILKNQKEVEHYRSLSPTLDNHNHIFYLKDDIARWGRKKGDVQNSLRKQIQGDTAAAIPAYTPDMLYQGGGKGLRAAFGGTPSTASMSDDLARAIAKDDAAASMISGGGASMFRPAGNATTNILAKLGLL